jgi:(E)-4-hydroxy-3-methylbut-2-enyl-diphosphate synthase
LVYRNGEKSHLIDTAKLVDEIESMVRARVSEIESARAQEILRTDGA